jgi:HAD superfamily hydrolase (TIGR01450 family)
MESMVKMIGEGGYRISYGEQMPNEKVAAVVAGMDRQINHDKIKVAMRLIFQGAAFIATNTDGSFPTPEGMNPGTGMVIGALQFVSETKPLVIGKPERGIFDAAVKGLNADIETTVMIGDRLSTDILGAQRLGIRTIAVLTGVTSRKELESSDIQPDFVFDDISGIKEALKGN